MAKNGDATEDFEMQQDDGDLIEKKARPGVLDDGICAYLKTSLGELILGTPMNILLVFVPCAFMAKATDMSDAWLFTFALTGLIPLAERISFVTEDLAKYTNETLGGLLNATFGNITELIICIYALKDGKLRIVQVSMLGSVFSNLLLVLGCAFFVGGYKHPQQTFNKEAATANISLLLLSVLGLLMPSVLDQTHDEAIPGESILSLSKVTATLLIGVYLSLIYFQLKSHRHMFEGEDDDEEDSAVLGFWGAVTWMAILTLFIAILSEYLVTCIEGAADGLGIPVLFIGTILLPIVGNAAEHAAAIIFAYRNKMELALGIAVGSATQISIFVIPSCVLVGWGMGQPFSLNFHPFETWTAFLVVVLVSFVIHNGESHYLKGIVLLAAYALVSAGFWVHKDPPDLG